MSINAMDNQGEIFFLQTLLRKKSIFYFLLEVYEVVSKESDILEDKHLYSSNGWFDYLDKAANNTTMYKRLEGLSSREEQEIVQHLFGTYFTDYLGLQKRIAEVAEQVPKLVSVQVQESGLVFSFFIAYVQHLLNIPDHLLNEFLLRDERVILEQEISELIHEGLSAFETRARSIILSMVKNGQASGIKQELIRMSNALILDLLQENSVIDRVDAVIDKLKR